MSLRIAVTAGCKLLSFMTITYNRTETSSLEVKTKFPWKKATSNEINNAFWLRNLLSSQNEGTSTEIEFSYLHSLKQNNQEKPMWPNIYYSVRQNKCSWITF